MPVTINSILLSADGLKPETVDAIRNACINSTVAEAHRRFGASQNLTVRDLEAADFQFSANVWTDTSSASASAWNAVAQGTVTVATGTAIPKNSVMRLSASPQTAAISASGGIMIGILNEEKTATDGKTKVSVLTHCTADLTCGAAESMVLGEPVIMGAVANEVTVQTDDTIANATLVVGVALETVAGNGTGTVLINVGRIR